MSELNWEEALEHLKLMKNLALDLGAVGIFYVQGCDEFKKRYDEGERTKKLYKEIMDLH